ncbi:helix-turn-helix domain-containing protein [Chitinophaga sp. XS-30]|uniref:helix-turn-helix domain-containing protein n=1 Tax=Chitinophaga sp. XS-30 TaxID=2604421 RepID=UPI0011DD6EE7|nr:helix-turn-helix domain-containing protein [Chitinophaga sp. XS-30]QEH43183.1 helix-turn-helix domain-containing protein [Chitinophaga sp. XS-30]
MAQKPIAMEQLKQILQLQKDGVGIREIARRTGISRNSVRKYVALLAKDDTSAESDDPDSKTLADRAYGNDSMAHDAHRLQQLVTHFQYAQGELGKTGVTRQLLWGEYIVQHPDGYVYSHYCHHFNQYLKNRDMSMHLEYQVGDILDRLTANAHRIELKGESLRRKKSKANQ